MVYKEKLYIAYNLNLTYHYETSTTFPVCLLSLYSRRQEYIPLLNDNSWYLHLSGFIDVDEKMWCEPIGDTIINDIKYTHYQEITYPFPDPSIPSVTNHYVREDLEERRVYKRYGDGEKLLYDFSLEIGDEVTVNLDDFDYTLIVVDKDSFAVDTGRKRLRLKLLESEGMIDPFPEYWIEGLGNLNHPLESLQWLMPDAWYTVLCNHYGDEMPYSVNEFMGEPFTCPEPTSEPEPDDYIPLINDNHWYVNSMMFTNMDSFWVQPVEEITINETVYTHYQETITVIDTPVVNDYYLREDVEAKRVYKLEEGNEYLMYDFSLEEGDNVTLDFAGELMEYVVVNKDSFAVNIGRQRVRLMLEEVGSEATETWIEGLGNLGHPLKNFQSIIQDPDYTLLCNNYDGEIAYTVAEFMGAPFNCPERGTEPEPPLNVNDHIIGDILIYPNPFTHSFIVTTDVPLEKAILTLHDVLGREIKRFNVSGNEIEVKRDGLPPGVYMLRIQRQGNYIVNYKLIAE